MSEKGNRAYNSRKGGMGGCGKGFYCDIDLDGPHSLDTSGTLCGMSRTTSNHAFVAQLALAFNFGHLGFSWFDCIGNSSSS